MTLEEATEKLNETIARAEAVFAARFAVRGSVPMAQGRHLAFGKFDGVWGLATKNPVTGNYARLSTTRRQIRTEAVGSLWMLFDELERQNGGTVADIEAAVASANEFLTKVEAA